MTEPYTLLDAAYAAARWGWYLTIFLVLGASSYAPSFFRSRTGIAHRHPAIAAAVGRRAARIGFVAALLLLVFVGLRLLLQSCTLMEEGEPLTAEFVKAVLGTDWGRGWLRQAAMSMVVLAGFGSALRGRSDLGWIVAGAAAGGLAIVAGMTGHAATERAGTLGLLLNAAHVWAGGYWLGGLAVMLVAGLGAARPLAGDDRAGVVRALVADFSRRALVCAPLAVGLGVWMGIRYLGWGWPLTLFDGGYPSALGIKLAALAAVAALGAWNWRRVQPMLSDPTGEPRLRTSATLELVFGVLLLAATAVLVALPLPGEHG